MLLTREERRVLGVLVREALVATGERDAGELVHQLKDGLVVFVGLESPVWNTAEEVSAVVVADATSGWELQLDARATLDELRRKGLVHVGPGGEVWTLTAGGIDTAATLGMTRLKVDVTDDELAQLAEDQHADDECQIDYHDDDLENNAPVVSRGEDGAWVRAWVWVDYPKKF